MVERYVFNYFKHNRIFEINIIYCFSKSIFGINTLKLLFEIIT